MYYLYLSVRQKRYFLIANASILANALGKQGWLPVYYFQIWLWSYTYARV